MAREKLTGRQRKALQALKDPANYWALRSRERWVQPSKIAAAIGARTVGGAVNTLNALVRRGLAEWNDEAFVLGYVMPHATRVMSTSVYRAVE